jgi:hypothetical protein
VLCGKPETYVLQLSVAFLHHHQFVSMIEVSNFLVIQCHHFCSYTLLFLFRHVHNIAKSELSSSCQSVSHGTNGWISRKLILRIVQKSVKKIQV